MRVRVLFFGTVQGVGFRYKAYILARGHNVTGYVKNLPDGSVLVEAQGDRKELRIFITDLERSMAGYVKSTEYNWLADGSDYVGFDIRY